MTSRIRTQPSRIWEPSATDDDAVVRVAQFGVDLTGLKKTFLLLQIEPVCWPTSALDEEGVGAEASQDVDRLAVFETPLIAFKLLGQREAE